ncbi:hypothetical protein [Rugamonas sp. DEMB1]|uniref:hypothetical protein n=1 Tax=Rugamonas sp. DEMB1 TaxID=3039386 RepID=UPI00244C1164|nr:hypothetical protein [Rugamonas sp. DEMB1]WGG51373.1 hypothetical protein QC826_03645 [Rugamonas sp. DEMB1]
MSTRRPDHAKLSRLWLPALLGLNLLLLVFYLAVDYQLSYHSDSAVKNLLAQEIAETGRYFPPDWNYANADLWVLNTQTWIVPLLRWFPNGFPLHAVSDLATAALTLLAAWAVCRVMGLSRAATLLGLAVLSAGMSPILAEHIFGQGAYGTMFYMVGFLLYAYWAQRRAAGRARWLWAAAAALLLLLVFWGSPSRGMAGYALPLLAALLALRWHERGAARRAGAAAPPPRYAGAVLAVLGAAGGVLLHLYTLRHVHNDPAAPLLWLSPADMGRNVLGVLEGLLSLFDGLPTTGAKVLGAFSVYQALRLLAALALLYLLPWALWRGLRHASGGMLFVLVFSAASTGLNLFVTATTTLADMHSPEASARYLVPSLILLLLGLAGVVLDRRGLGLAPRLAGGAVLLVLAGSAPTTYLRPLSENLDLPWRGARLVTRDTRMIDFLAGQGLQYGYATFWNAGKLSVLSGQRVRVRQIVVERGLPQPMRKLASNRWYNASAWQARPSCCWAPTNWPRSTWSAWAGWPARRAASRSRARRSWSSPATWRPPCRSGTPNCAGRPPTRSTPARRTPSARCRARRRPWWPSRASPACSPSAPSARSTRAASRSASSSRRPAPASTTSAWSTSPSTAATASPTAPSPAPARSA